MMSKLPKQSLEVLKALSYFHYLTSQQLVDLGIAKSVDSLNNWALAKLLPPPKAKSSNGKQKLSRYYCNSLRYGNTDAAQAGVKLPYMHYMTQRGLDYLEWACEDEVAGEEIWVPKPKEVLTNDYFHRIHYVTAHMCIRRWALSVGAEIDFFTHDYQGDPHKPSNSLGRPQSINKIICDAKNEIKPDGIMGITYNGESRLFVLELHNRTPTKAVIEQLYRNFSASEAIRAKFANFPIRKDPFVLSVYTDKSIMAAAQRRVAQTPAFQSVLNGLFFAYLEDIKYDSKLSWSYADGRPVLLFGTQQS